MQSFMNENFLLQTETAKRLYHDYASKVPIIDYHCHINPREIAEDKHFRSITELWLGGDHYKWRQMRSNGIDEKYITGDADDREKFRAWAITLQKAIGNPLYHWSHLELQRYFDIYEPLTEKNCDAIFDRCNELLSKPDMSARNIILRSNVTTVCTTDDPIDSLEWHRAIKADNSFPVQVLPAWRPDKAMSIEKPDYIEYIKTLESVSGVTINSFATLKKALINRMEFFNDNGCNVSDHGLSFVTYRPAPESDIELYFNKRLNGEELTLEEELKFKTAFMIFVGKEYHRLGWVMQLHYGAKRDNNTRMFNTLGPDTGFDCINSSAPAAELADFLNALNLTDELPKTIVYSLNPIDNAAIGTIIGCFQDSSAIGKIQQGSAWWFNDHKTGMIDQMTSLANLGLLANFVGMLTDSRSFISYTRHEYFRRILCNLIGGWVENGEYPADYEMLGQMIQDISYYNCKRYFNF